MSYPCVHAVLQASVGWQTVHRLQSNKVVCIAWLHPVDLVKTHTWVQDHTPSGHSAGAGSLHHTLSSLLGRRLAASDPWSAGMGSKGPCCFCAALLLPLLTRPQARATARQKTPTATPTPMYRELRAGALGSAAGGNNSRIRYSATCQCQLEACAINVVLSLPQRALIPDWLHTLRMMCAWGQPMLVEERHGLLQMLLDITRDVPRQGAAVCVVQRHYCTCRLLACCFCKQTCHPCLLPGTPRVDCAGVIHPPSLWLWQMTRAG